MITSILIQGVPFLHERIDFNRVLLQVNGENNNDPVIAYFDDFNYNGQIGYDPEQSESVFDQLVWYDEFDGSGAVNVENWHHQTQLPNSWGWFNGEQQHYTDREDNSYVEDGNLHIVAKREDYADQGLLREFTSARLNSKFAFTYGRVEVRAKLPVGGGTWPAIWTLGKNVNEWGAYWQPQFGAVSWPACGEIDIMEHWAWNENYVSSALHTPSSFAATENNGGLYSPDIFDTFHVYGMEWDEEEIRFMIDGQIHYIYHPQVQNASTWPFDEDQYLILNVALQDYVDPNFQESEMVIDYVRVYQSSPTSVDELSINAEVDVYPNPAQDIITLTIDEAWIGAELQVIDALGAIVFQDQVLESNPVINVQALPAGIYAVQLIQGGQHLQIAWVKD